MPVKKTPATDTGGVMMDEEPIWIVVAGGLKEQIEGLKARVLDLELMVKYPYLWAKHDGIDSIRKETDAS